MLLAWQALHQLVGATALPAPVPTLRYLARFLPTARFAENAWATLVSFFCALILSYALGLAIGVWMGVHRLSGAVGEPILISLYTLPKITLYPVVLLIFGLSTVRPGDLRRDAWRAAGRTPHHERDPQYPAGVSEVGADPASVERADNSHRAVSGDPSGGRFGTADRLHPHAARRTAGRNVCRQAWSWVSDHQRHAAAAEPRR